MSHQDDQWSIETFFASKLSLIHWLSAEVLSALHLQVSTNLSLSLSQDSYDKRSQWLEWVIQCWKWTCWLSIDKENICYCFSDKISESKSQKTVLWSQT